MKGPLFAAVLTLLLAGCAAPPPPAPEPEGTGIGILSDEALAKTARDVDDSTELHKQSLADDAAADPAFGSQQLPVFIKPYYASMLTLAGEQYKFVQREKDGLVRGSLFIYLSSNPSATGVAMTRCLPQQCEAVWKREIELFTRDVTKTGGVLNFVSEREFIAKQDTNKGGGVILRAFLMPRSLIVWFHASPHSATPPQEWFDKLSPLIERDRAEEAAALANQVLRK